MPRYFFHHADGYVDYDDEGIELANVNEARIEAVVFAAASLRDDPTQIWNGQEFRVEVTDERGSLLFVFAATAIDATGPMPDS